MDRFIKHLFSYRHTITLALFFMGTLHTMIFAVFQIPSNFLMGRDPEHWAVMCKLVLYIFAVGTSLSHQLLCRWMGLRRVLLLGLICNAIGTIGLMVNQLQDEKGALVLLFSEMVIFGIATTSVINSLLTYVVLEFPKKVGIGIIILFAFFNLGSLLAPPFLELAGQLTNGAWLYPTLLCLILLSIWLVHSYFFDPKSAEKTLDIQKKSDLFKQLHYRLGLFVLAITGYSLAESTFSLWGYEAIVETFSIKAADQVTPIFWLFLIIGQFVLLIPLHFLPARKTFYFLTLVLIVSAFGFPAQKSLFGFTLWLAIAGFGCSAVFPILLAQMESEMIPFAKGGTLVSYIEKGISLMFAGYFTGVAIIDLWILKLKETPPIFLKEHFHLAAIFMLLTGCITVFLDFTSSRKKIF